MGSTPFRAQSSPRKKLKERKARDGAAPRKPAASINSQLENQEKESSPKSREAPHVLRKRAWENRGGEERAPEEERVYSTWNTNFRKPPVRYKWKLKLPALVVSEGRYNFNIWREDCFTSSLRASLRWTKQEASPAQLGPGEETTRGMKWSC